MRIDRIDPVDLDLDTADAMSAIERAHLDAAGLPITSPTGPARLLLYRHGWDGTPIDGLWVARDGGRLVGYVSMELPRRENTDRVKVLAGVDPAYTRRGICRALVDAAVTEARPTGRTTLRSGTFEGTDGLVAARALGFRAIHRMAVRHLDLDAPAARWTRLYDEAAGVATEYELVRSTGPTADDLVDEMVALHAAINDAPASDPKDEPDDWTAERVRATDRALELRRQTVYRVAARHRRSGDWAGHTLVCVDELDPTIAHQEDTAVVAAHRGHRLGLLLKADMLRWLARERPEVRSTETWNALENRHMLAVNERIGTRVVAQAISLKRAL